MRTFWIGNFIRALICKQFILLPRFIDILYFEFYEFSIVWEVGREGCALKMEIRFFIFRK